MPAQKVTPKTTHQLTHIGETPRCPWCRRENPETMGVYLEHIQPFEPRNRSGHFDDMAEGCRP